MSTSPNEIHINLSRSKTFLPVYDHLVESQASINFLWGGRDAGRSTFIAMRLLIDCMTLPYFRCILMKKTHNSIQEAQWQTLKDVAESWKVDHLFIFKTSPLAIICKANGNRFLARGADQPIKSIKDPSHAWYEEGNELTMDDFIIVTTTLRSSTVKIQQWFSFNPEVEGDYEEFWLYKTFFKGKPDNGQFVWQFKKPDGEVVDYVYTLTHATYKDNRYCAPERIAMLEMMVDIDPYYYQVFTLGKWGRRKNNAPYFFAFSREKHVRPTKLDRSQVVYLSFDFNKNPIVCNVYQYFADSVVSDKRIRGIESIKLADSDIYKLCDYILAAYPGCLFMITGDATGRNTTALVKDNMNFYTVIKQKLKLTSGQIKVPGVNPSIEENQLLCNAVLNLVPTDIDPVNCKELIFDFENVRVTPDGKIEKKDREDPAQQADNADCFRYFCNAFFKWVLKIPEKQKINLIKQPTEKEMISATNLIERVKAGKVTPKGATETNGNYYLGDGVHYFYIKANGGPVHYEKAYLCKKEGGEEKRVHEIPVNGRDIHKLINVFEALQIMKRF